MAIKPEELGLQCANAVNTQLVEVISRRIVDQLAGSMGVRLANQIEKAVNARMTDEFIEKIVTKILEDL